MCVWALGERHDEGRILVQVSRNISIRNHIETDSSDGEISSNVASWRCFRQWDFWRSELSFHDLGFRVSVLAFQSVGISHVGASVRLLGRDGAAANVGLLQVRMQGSRNNEFGSVCGMNAVCL